MASAKPHMNLVFIGHVDHGKSTLVGRVLLDTGHIEPHVIEKFKKEAESKGKGSFEFAWVMDNLKEERERGVTIDVAHKKFTSKKYDFTIIDAPGHRDFVKNMITGTSQADAAVLVVAAPDGVMAQTKEHAFLSKVLGVDQIIVAVNKMDSVEYKEARFKEVADEATKLLRNAGYRPDAITVIPVSAFVGDNVNGAVENMPWYKGSTLVASLDDLTLPEKATDLNLRMPLQDVYTITGVGTVPVGRIESGVLKIDQKVIVRPSSIPGGAIGEVKNIEMHHEAMTQAVPGDNVGCNVRGIGKKDIRRGDVMGPADDPPVVAKRFKAQIMVLNHPSVIAAGYTPVFHCHTAQVACRFDKLVAKLNPRTGAVEQENPDYLKTGDAGIVEIVPVRPMVIEEQAKYKPLSRFAIRDMGVTVAAGMCIKVLEEQK